MLPRIPLVPHGEFGPESGIPSYGRPPDIPRLPPRGRGARALSDRAANLRETGLGRRIPEAIPIEENPAGPDPVTENPIQSRQLGRREPMKCGRRDDGVQSAGGKRGRPVGAPKVRLDPAQTSTKFRESGAREFEEDGVKVHAPARRTREAMHDPFGQGSGPGAKIEEPESRSDRRPDRIEHGRESRFAISNVGGLGGVPATAPGPSRFDPQGGGPRGGPCSPNRHGARHLDCVRFVPDRAAAGWVRRVLRVVRVRRAGRVARRRVRWPTARRAVGGSRGPLRTSCPRNRRTSGSRWGFASNNSYEPGDCGSKKMRALPARRTRWTYGPPD